MGHGEDILTREQFLRHLRHALNHLYDPDDLRASPLAALLDLGDRFDAPSALQRALTEAIESLKPEAGKPLRSPAWRIYNLLYYRYVQRLSQQQLADQLNLSVRHMRREQRAALEALGMWLWQRFGLEERAEDATEAATDSAEKAASGVDEELAWLKEAPPEEGSDLGQTLRAAAELILPLAAKQRVRLQIGATDVLRVAAHPAALRQMLLNLLNVAIRRSAGTTVVASTTTQGWQVAVQLRSNGVPINPPATSQDDATNLGLVRQLAALCGGRLHIPTASKDKPFEAMLVLPALEQLPVLAIDDNADVLQLLQRYTAGTRYRLVGARDPERILELAQALAPQIIVVDVMMPGVDGWELLARLRQHPSTARTPVIVCTILAQEDLALALGASGFVRKPITRRAFLSALDRQVGELETESR
jgi:CheY-like chemotaxis protein